MFSDRDGKVLAISNQGTPNVPTTIMSYSYDGVGNTKFISETINGTIEITTSQQYDALNRLTQNTQGSMRIDYTYNAISQVTNKKRYADATGTNLVAETNHLAVLSKTDDATETLKQIAKLIDNGSHWLES